MSEWQEHYVTFNGHPWEEIRARVLESLKAKAGGWSFSPSAEDYEEALTEARLDLAHYWQLLPSSRFDPEDPKRSLHFAVKRATHKAVEWLWDEHDYRTSGLRRPLSARAPKDKKPNPYEARVRDGLTDDEWNKQNPAALGWAPEPTPPKAREPEYKPWRVAEQERIVRVLVDNVLEPNERTVILALFWEGLSLSETAPLIGRSSNHPVARLRDKALGRLRWWLDDKTVQRFVVNRVKTRSNQPEGRPRPGGRPSNHHASRPRRGRQAARFTM